MRLLHVVGTRPNFVKMAPVIAATRERFGADASIVVHTGQHYDRAMSDVFLEELGVPEPDHMLGVGSGTHAEQTARVLERLEPVLAREPGRIWSSCPATSTRPSPPRSARRGSGSRSATSSRGCAASTARCPRRSTGC